MRLSISSVAPEAHYQHLVRCILVKDPDDRTVMGNVVIDLEPDKKVYFYAMITNSLVSTRKLFSFSEIFNCIKPWPSGIKNSTGFSLTFPHSTVALCNVFS